MDIFDKIVSAVSADKLLHFIAGLLMMIVLYLLSDIFTAFCITVVIGIAKEIYDMFTDGTFDVWDLVSTFIGSAIGCLIILLV